MLKFFFVAEALVVAYTIINALLDMPAFARMSLMGEDAQQLGQFWFSCIAPGVCATMLAMASLTPARQRTFAWSMVLVQLLRAAAVFIYVDHAAPVFNGMFVRYVVAGVLFGVGAARETASAPTTRTSINSLASLVQFLHVASFCFSVYSLMFNADQFVGNELGIKLTAGTATVAKLMALIAFVPLSLWALVAGLTLAPSELRAFCAAQAFAWVTSAVGQYVVMTPAMPAFALNMVLCAFMAALSLGAVFATSSEAKSSGKKKK